MDGSERFRIVRIADSLSDRDVGYTGYDHDVSAPCLAYRHSAEPLVYEYLIDFILADASVFLGYSDHLGFPEGTSCYPSDAQSADIVVIGKSGYLHLQRLFVPSRIRIAVIHDALEQRLYVESAESLRRLLDLGLSVTDADALNL